jgi:hypothetical protein
MIGLIGAPEFIHNDEQLDAHYNTVSTTSWLTDRAYINLL